MSIKKINIDEFIEMGQLHPVLDVRSPGEFKHAHIHGAYSLPLFSDEERKIVGTSYKQQSRQQAIKLGLGLFGVKMKGMVEEAELIVHKYKVEVSSSSVSKETNDNKHQTSNTLLLHCWRGGMRSAAVAWLLDLYGFHVHTLNGGYKAFRNWALQQFEKDYNFNILGGYTGSGKTALLHELQKKGHQTIDLEQIAHHKGSAFGGIGESEQPSQEMFENRLAVNLHTTSKPEKNLTWIEDESQRIGRLNIPNSLWRTMRTKPVYFLDIPFEERLDYISVTYGLHDKEKLVNAIIRIQKRLGPLEAKTAIGFLVEDNYKACFEVILRYYDKLYNKGLYNRDNTHSLLNNIKCSSVDSIFNTQNLLTCTTINS